MKNVGHSENKPTNGNFFARCRRPWPLPGASVPIEGHAQNDLINTFTGTSQRVEDRNSSREHRHFLWLFSDGIALSTNHNLCTIALADNERPTLM